MTSPVTTTLQTLAVMAVDKTRIGSDRPDRTGPYRSGSFWSRARHHNNSVVASICCMFAANIFFLKIVRISCKVTSQLILSCIHELVYRSPLVYNITYANRPAGPFDSFKLRTFAIALLYFLAYIGNCVNFVSFDVREKKSTNK